MKAGVVLNIIAVPLLVVALGTWGDALFDFQNPPDFFFRNVTSSSPSAWRFQSAWHYGAKYRILNRSVTVPSAWWEIFLTLRNVTFGFVFLWNASSFLQRLPHLSNVTAMRLVLHFMARRPHFCLNGPINYISFCESLPQPWYNPLWLTGFKTPVN